MKLYKCNTLFSMIFYMTNIAISFFLWVSIYNSGMYDGGLWLELILLSICAIIIFGLNIETQNGQLVINIYSKELKNYGDIIHKDESHHRYDIYTVANKTFTIDKRK